MSATTEGPTFALSNLTYAYGSRWKRPSLPAVTGVTSEIHPGVTAVLGLSGSGKTTLLNLLGLLADARLQPGQITFRGTADYAALRSSAQVKLRRDAFGFVLQSSFLLPHFSCWENVAVPLALVGIHRAERRKRVERLFAQADLSGRLTALMEKRPRDISGGERQRVAVLRAIVHDPLVLFADEPLSSLDPLNAKEMLKLLRHWLNGGMSLASAPDRRRTLLLVSHDVSTAVRFAEGRCLIMRAGAMVRGPDRPVPDERTALVDMGVIEE